MTPAETEGFMPENLELSPQEIQIKELFNQIVDTPEGYLVYEDMADFTNQLEAEFGKEAVRKNLLYHAMIGSTLAPERRQHCTDQDFPGQYSILKFLKKLLKKYQQ